MSSCTDVIGVCKSVDEMTRLTTKTGREVSKRTVNLIDMSGKMVSVTLWGEEVRTGEDIDTKYISGMRTQSLGI